MGYKEDTNTISNAVWLVV